MIDDRASDQPPPVELSIAAMREWNRIVDAVLRGLGHALNNRAAALSAVIELSKDDGPEATASILTTELQRMRELSALVRSMGAPRPGMEAFSPRDAAAEALTVLSMHADQRDRVVMIEAGAS